MCYAAVCGFSAYHGVTNLEDIWTDGNSSNMSYTEAIDEGHGEEVALCFEAEADRLEALLKGGA